jgi:tRNA G37 N-methylase TrmD
MSLAGHAYGEEALGNGIDDTQRGTNDGHIMLVSNVGHAASALSLRRRFTETRRITSRAHVTSGALIRAGITSLAGTTIPPNPAGGHIGQRRINLVAQDFIWFAGGWWGGIDQWVAARIYFRSR